MHFAGYADDFRSVLAEAAFLVCPVFGGTGQQVKIVEAMAHGLAVVALRDAAERSPLEHGISGLVADTAEEFAEHVLTLWKDRALCRALGQAARRVVTEQLSEGRLMDALTPMLRAAT
jgi:glycosyltransferase involved in cell wall biosynthesis